ncbi:hypothetical protein C8R44DRAFT_733928 [Mycena epipterygia]|nr:hypothetical protein C8R44DRAFT_733928 [Mycena epipterygia]
MQVFPLLLQLSFLLFATALSIYLGTIHRTIAAIALSLAVLGSFLYAVMVFSALVLPDSPFQTSLSFLLKIILTTSLFPSAGAAHLSLFPSSPLGMSPRRSPLLCGH